MRTADPSSPRSESVLGRRKREKRNGTERKYAEAAATSQRGQDTRSRSPASTCMLSTTTFTPARRRQRLVLEEPSARRLTAKCSCSDSFKGHDRLALGPNVSYAGTRPGAGTVACWRSARTGGRRAPTRYNARWRWAARQPARRTQSPPSAIRRRPPGELRGRDRRQRAGRSAVQAVCREADRSVFVDGTRWAHGQSRSTRIRQTPIDQLINASLTADSLGITDPTKPVLRLLCGRRRVLQRRAAHSAGTPAFTSPNRSAGRPGCIQGIHAQANIGIGKNIVVIRRTRPAAPTSWRQIRAFLGFNSTLILGSQLPGRPVHSGNLTIDALYAPAKLELLANAHYVRAAKHNQYSRAVRAGQLGRLTSASDRPRHGVRVEPVSPPSPPCSRPSCTRSRSRSAAAARCSRPRAPTRRARTR